MAKRKTQYEPPIERQRSPGEQPTAYGYQIRSRALRFREGKLSIARRHAENFSKDDVTIDLAELLLPPNLLHPKVQRLIDRPDFARVIVAVVDSYMLRQKNTKSTASTARTLAGTVMRFLEYCWLNDIYHLKEVTSARWESFFRTFAKGGWHLVLALEGRVEEIDLRTIPIYRRKAAKPRKMRKERYASIACASVLRAIGTNVASNQVSLDYRPGTIKAVLRPTRGEAAMSESLLTQVINQLNNLADLPREMRASSVAHPNPYLYAALLEGVPPSRTDNFDPPALAALMAESYRWVSIYGDLIVRLSKRVFSAYATLARPMLAEPMLIELMEAPERLELEAALGVNIETVRHNGDWESGVGLVGLMRTLLASCFLLLGVFNARRKDEIQSRSIGLYAGAFECADDELGIYQSFFYCEKTSMDYRQFFVNEISYKALMTTKALSDISWETVSKNGGDVPEGRLRKTFCMPPREHETSPIWYDYSSDPGIGLLCERATGKKNLAVPNAHMFRRAYAVVFHYRYENADLYALSQQLDHHDLNMTLHYVLEGASRVLAHHAATLWGDGGETKRERALLAADLNKEVNKYGKEKLHDDVKRILAGEKSVAGGFPELVQRFSRRMYGRIKYDDENLRSAAKGLSGILIDRGHTVVPLRHGNCNAGRAKPSARCYRDGRLARENASPLVCGDCPYHAMKRMHLQVIEDDMERERAYVDRLDADSLQARQARHALQATERLITFYKRKGLELQ